MTQRGVSVFLIFVGTKKLSHTIYIPFKQDDQPPATSKEYISAMDGQVTTWGDSNS